MQTKDLKFEAVSKKKSLITVYAYLTFEGNPIMRLDQFHDHRKLGTKNPLLVRMEITPTDHLEVFRIGRISDGKVSAYRECWMHQSEFVEALEQFQKHGYEYIHTYQLTRV
jgi:hypothetical protein